MRIIHQQVALVNPSAAKFADNLSFQTLSSLLHSRHLLVRRGGNERDSPRFAAFRACLFHVLDRNLIDFRKVLRKFLVCQQQRTACEQQHILLRIGIAGGKIFCKGSADTQQQHLYRISGFIFRSHGILIELINAFHCTANSIFANLHEDGTIRKNLYVPI